MLRKIIESKSTLIDYEKIIDKQGKRQVYFGNFAGDAGTINIFWLMGQYWRNMGIETPFAECRQTLEYYSVDEAKKHFRQIGEKIKRDGIPASINPMVVAILGYGNVSKGAQSILNCLPVVEVQPSDLNTLNADKASSNQVYMTVFKEEDLVRSKSGEPFNLREYYDHPEMYESDFSRYLPYVSIIINATFWDQRYPRFVTWKGLEELYKIQPRMKLQGIADITCDVNGSIECNVKTTDSGNPAYLVDPITKRVHTGYKGAGIVMLAVDNLPAELPNDASTFFSGQLKKYVPNILKADFSSDLNRSGLHEDVKKAVIVYNGELTSAYKYLEKSL
jgi:saccharopine dehydrogenase (NAD+, L-lysine-forming)